MAVGAQQRQQRRQVEAVADNGQLAERLADAEVPREAGSEEQRQAVARVLPEGRVGHQLVGGAEQRVAAGVAARRQLLLGLAQQVLQADAVLGGVHGRTQRRHVERDARRLGLTQRTQVFAAQ